MKRVLIIALTILLLTAVMITPAFAAGTASAECSASTLKKGDTVEVTVSLSGILDGVTAIGVTIPEPSGLVLEAAQWDSALTGMKGVDGTNAAFAYIPKDEKSPPKLVCTSKTAIFKITYRADGSVMGNISINIPLTVKDGSTSIAVEAPVATVKVVNPVVTLNLDTTSLSFDLKNDTAAKTLTANITAADPSLPATDATITWTSSDTSLVAVSNTGVVTLVSTNKIGSAVITAKTANGKEDTCAVTVTCAHNLTPVAKVEPTCRASGNKAYSTCDLCGSTVDANGNVVAVENMKLDPIPHKTTHHAAVAATCKAKGNIEYWTCEYESGKKFSDAACNNEVASVETAVNANNHVNTEVRNKKSATCDKEGYSGDTYCLDCGNKIKTGTTVPATNNHLRTEVRNKKSATCDKAGYTGDTYCLDCGNKIKTGITVSATGNHLHTEVRDKVAPSCYKAGYSGDTYCTDCGNKIKTGTTVAATGEHVAGSEWKSDATNHWHVCTTSGCTAKTNTAAHTFTWKVDLAATEDATGLKHEECSVCGYKRNENTVIDKLDHKHIDIKHYQPVKSTCTKEGVLEYWTCGSSKCKDIYYGDFQCQIVLDTIVETIDLANHSGKAVQKNDDKEHWNICSDCEREMEGSRKAHTFSWIVDKQPTEQAEGVKHQECSVCKFVTDADTVIDKLPHIPTLVVGTDPTCTEDGMMEHYYCSNCGSYYTSEDGVQGEYVSKDELLLAATGHTFGEEWLSDGENHWHECECGEKSEPEAHKTELVDAKEATETETGYTGDTVCTVCGAEVAKGEEIPVLGTEEEPTEAPEATDAPTEPAQKEEPEKTSGGFAWWIIPLIVVIVGAVWFFLIGKKRKKAE